MHDSDLLDAIGFYYFCLLIFGIAAFAVKAACFLAYHGLRLAFLGLRRLFRRLPSPRHRTERSLSR